VTPLKSWTGLAAATWCAALALCHAAPAQLSSDASRDPTAEPARIAFAHALPRIDGSHLRVTMVEVRYGPGESSPPHSHPCPVIGYVIAGTVRSQVKGQPEATYKAGDSFYEAPNGVHIISANATDKRPAKFIAYFICDRDTPLSVAPPETPVSGGKP
jgi:quercetin dioxygenase-like cupin family protein